MGIFGERGTMRVQLYISLGFAKAVVLVLVLIVLGLTALSSVFEFSSLILRVGGGEMQLFDLDADQNIPTWFSASMLLMCAVLFAAIAVAARGNVYGFHWVGLSAIFLYLSVDESASVHEKLRPFLQTRLQTGGFLDYVWVFLYAPLVLIFALVYLRFLFSLPAQTRRLFFVAGILYVGGALVMEAIGGLYATLYGTSGIVYPLFTHIEEILEMLGIVVLFYTLLLYIGSHVKELHVGTEVRKGSNADALR